MVWVQSVVQNWTWPPLDLFNGHSSCCDKQNAERLLVFCDGTSMDGNLLQHESGNTITASTICQISGCCRNGRHQFVCYQSGVGLKANFEEASVTKQYGVQSITQLRGTGNHCQFPDVIFHTYYLTSLQPPDDCSEVPYNTATKLSVLIVYQQVLSILRHSPSFWLKNKEKSCKTDQDWNTQNPLIYPRVTHAVP
ncbi:hypothetical protein DFJ58DRAFT_844030 [Suillus subalutaceus]|uniref:uncharacterized protein n=1 Tax=Suillus subalutaceus TaxID=48586 RepID=UPI001B87991B|nr:uncharacterized protein DFJ58DRAFT_844030 [Suillus subalutaceus]KAG1844539.1 hypothetical protein DFJ58DRAFT_844030 [Suillus subalutaceus]